MAQADPGYHPMSTALTPAAAAPASAAAVVYSNEAAFQGATGATLHALAAGAAGALSVSTVDGELQFSVPAGVYTDWQSYSGVSRLAGVEMAINGFESFDGNVNLGADRYAFGFGIYEAGSDTSAAGCNTTCVQSKFEITLRNNGVDLAPSFFLEPADDQAVFWGVHTDFAFDSIKIREIVGGFDNEIFGTFYTGLNQASATPEPGTLLLVGAGLAAAGLRRRGV